MKRLFGAVSIALCALSLAACGSTNQPAASEPAASSSTPSPEGMWGSEAKGQPHLEFEAGGAVSGNDGCNNLTGAWTQKAEEIDLGNLAGTMMACEGVDTWINAAHSASMAGDEMTLKNAGGQAIGTLTRAK